MADETNRNVTEQPQDMGELLRIRRDKLKALQDAGTRSLYHHQVRRHPPHPGYQGQL